MLWTSYCNSLDKLLPPKCVLKQTKRRLGTYGNKGLRPAAQEILFCEVKTQGRVLIYYNLASFVAHLSVR